MPTASDTSTTLRVTVGSGAAAHLFEALAGGAKASELNNGGRAFDRALCGKGGELRLAEHTMQDCRRCAQIAG